MHLPRGTPCAPTLGQRQAPRLPGPVSAAAENASGGSARAVINAGSTFDISRLSSVGTTVGSLNGAGQLSLGSKALTVGGSGASTTFSGLLADGGQPGGSGGRLGVAPGTLTNGTLAFTVTGVPEPGMTWPLLAAGGGSWVLAHLRRRRGFSGRGGQRGAPLSAVERYVSYRQGHQPPQQGQKGASEGDGQTWGGWFREHGGGAAGSSMTDATDKDGLTR